MITSDSGLTLTGTGDAAIAGAHIKAIKQRAARMADGQNGIAEL